MPFPVFEKELEEARVLLSEILSNGRKNELIEAIKDIRPDLLDNKAVFDKVTVDMELYVSVLGFIPALGKETEKIEVTEHTDLHALYERIASNGRYFILEDLIRPHPDLKRLNPDSVNTIRVVTFLDRNEPMVLDSYFRTGQAVSFVDNAGSGGILIHADPEKGITDSHGLDKKGLFISMCG